MSGLPPEDCLAQTLAQLLEAGGIKQQYEGKVSAISLPSSRPVYRFAFPRGDYPVVGKFFTADPLRTPLDLGLAQEYDNYLQLPALGLNHDAVPRLLGRRPQVGLGLLLEAVSGPDLDYFLARACAGSQDCLDRPLAALARLLVRFHTRPVAGGPITPGPALSYLDKVMRQLAGMDLLTPADQQALAVDGSLWAAKFASHTDLQVLVHGDATPTNFLFPDGRAVALDLERLRLADRLWDLSWVAAELKHAWGWRLGNFNSAEPAIRHFFQAYLEALAAAPAVARRLYHLNPFYMGLAELRIARNAYLSRDYRQELVAEARRCLAAVWEP